MSCPGFDTSTEVASPIAARSWTAGVALVEPETVEVEVGDCRPTAFNEMLMTSPFTACRFWTGSALSKHAMCQRRSRETVLRVGVPGHPWVSWFRTQRAQSTQSTPAGRVSAVSRFWKTRIQCESRSER